MLPFPWSQVLRLWLWVILWRGSQFTQKSHPLWNTLVPGRFFTCLLHCLHPGPGGSEALRDGERDALRNLWGKETALVPVILSLKDS